jgi:hypothetical protein
VPPPLPSTWILRSCRIGRRAARRVNDPSYNRFFGHVDGESIDVA